MKLLFYFFLQFAIWTSFIACKTPSVTATQSVINGNIANNANRYDDAITHYEKYLSASAQLGLYRDYAEEAVVCRNLAHAYATKGKFNQTESYLKKAILKDSVASNQLALIEDYRDLGEAYAYQGEYTKSLLYLSKALVVDEGMVASNKNVKKISAAHTNLALARVHVSAGNFKEAEGYSFKALALYTTFSSDHSGETEVKLLLGIIAREKNQMAQAENYLTESVALCEKHGFNSARQQQALSEVYWLKGDIENTMRLKLLALEQAQKTNILPMIIIAQMRIGDVYQKLGDQKKASYYYQKALELEAAGDASSFAPSLKMRMGDSHGALDYYSRSGPSLGKALVSLRLGQMYLQENKADSAESFFMQSLNYFEKVENKEGLANTKFQLAKVYFLKGDYRLSKTSLHEAKVLSIQPDLQWQIYYRLGMVEEAQGRVDSARADYQRAIRIIDNMRGNLTVEEFKTLFANTKVEVYDKLIQLLLKNKSRWVSQPIPVVEEAFYLAEQSRSRAFLDMMGNHRIDPKSGSDTVLLEREQQLRFKLQQVSKDLNSAIDSDIRYTLHQQLNTLQDEHQQVSQRIKLNNPAYAGMVSIEPTRLSALQEKMDAKSAVLEYWAGDDVLVIWVIKKKSIDAKTVDVSKKRLLREIQGCRNALNIQFSELTHTTLTTLYKHLIQPILPEIKNVSKLTIIPHASLHFLPFQALQADRAKFLIEDYVISYAPSASVLYSCMDKKPEKQHDVLGMAIGDQAIGDFAALPGTASELRHLAKVNDKLTHQIGKACTETYLKREVSKYGYIHLATHGAMNTYQPLYTYLLMHPTEEDDGRLSVDEIFGMDIRGKLVTLSACETGLGELGEGDELVGLSRAFMYAGAPAVMVTLWKVEDATTAWLMTRFYQYLNAGQPTAEALAFAQRDLIKGNFGTMGNVLRGSNQDIEFDKEIKDAMNKRKGAASRVVYFWAPFVLLGSPQ